VQISEPALAPATHAERILRSLPRWFGIEQALLQYAADSHRYPTFLAEEGEPVGFITVHEHFPSSWEVHCVAVHAAHRGKGVGRQLHTHAEAWLRRQDAQFLQVKTLAAFHPSPEYAETRRFYKAMGYTPLEVFPTLWVPKLPVLQLVKCLSLREDAA
jgi:GNAT superfamily N-acetyltransferase